MVDDMTLNDIQTNVKVIHFGTSRFLLQAVNSNFGSRTHRLATIHNITDDDRRRTQHCTYRKRDR